MKQRVINDETRDFVELTRDVSSSPLWNRDLAPTTIRERTWTTWNIAALWIGMTGRTHDAAAITMLRMITAMPPGKVRFTILDPVGLGENFASFM